MSTKVCGFDPGRYNAQTGRIYPMSHDSRAIFDEIVQSRRSVRVFESDPIPESDVEKVLEWSLLAPHSSNLQVWKFYWVEEKHSRDELIKACFSQSAARSAPVLIVCTARPHLATRQGQRMFEALLEQKNKGQEVPKALLDYYGKLVPLVYGQGPLGVLGLLRRLLVTIVGLFRVVPRFPHSPTELREWAVKSAALACENMMLGFRALGYDSCPMEGFDENRVKSLLKLERQERVVMVVGAGRRSPKGVWGERFRFPSSEFIKRIR